ncbi:asparagine synthase C-terminal domain-containing protein [Oleiagrimonas sp. C23AA]|uniref:asparagine synthase-related protein n=1 Tax=Oleiagrimonas sp. C23AA TaxID=2719047 RepID=UPI0014241FA3|nr:asparagine synthase C-terminal domain-containing protein [Oleiagrimonas sp. C23AA]NII09472.1 asparagine synthase [Oleiagrimonas sp. C23AA]
MSHRYIALTDKAFGHQHAGALALQHLSNRGQVGHMIVFAARETPVLTLPDGGLLLGEIYDRHGRPVANPMDLPTAPTPAHLRQQLLEQFWGEYLLFQPVESSSAGFTVMRDPSGGLACVYRLREGHGFITGDLALASELGLHKDHIDWEFVRHNVRHPHMKISRTGLVGVRELLPGCLLAVDAETTTTQVAWSPWRFVAEAQRQTEPTSAALMLREAITTAVHAMAETDRRLLLELSGGLDSSIVGGCLLNVGAHVDCCTVTTPLPGADEREYASLIARQLGIELLQHPLSFADADIGFELPAHSPRPAAWALGRAVAHAMDHAAETQGVHSLFSGGGGDSVFCYLHSAAPAADALRIKGLAEGGKAIVNLSRLHGCTVAKATRLTLRKLCRQPKAPYESHPRFLADANESLPPLELHPWFDAPPRALHGDRERIFDLAGNQLFRDGTLRAAGRRVRFPLLSQPVMEACLRIPSWMWITQGHNRAMARAAFANQLPPAVLHRRSKGTFMNYTFAVYRKNTQAIGRFLLDGQLSAHGLLDTQALHQFLHSPLPALDRTFMRVFDLCMIENWARNHA